jgi:hypothetical protein
MMEQVMQVVAGLAVIALVGLMVGTIVAVPVMLIWNYMMPELFGAPYLTFWQAFWGTFLIRMLFTVSVTPTKKS